MPMRVGLGKLRAGGWSDDEEQMKRKWGKEWGFVPLCFTHSNTIRALDDDDDDDCVYPDRQTDEPNIHPDNNRPHCHKPSSPVVQ